MREKLIMYNNINLKKLLTFHLVNPSLKLERMKMFYLIIHSTHFVYNYMA